MRQADFTYVLIINVQEKGETLNESLSLTSFSHKKNLECQRK